MDNDYKITLLNDVIDYDIIYNFPYKKFPKIRASQEYILKRIQNGLNEGKRMFILEAPTGIGKSAIAITCGKYLEGCYIITMTKELQSQYCNDFPYIRKITGKSDYLCPVQEFMLGDKPCDICRSFKRSKCIHRTAEFGPCRTEEAYRGENCQHHTLPSLKHYNIVDQLTDKENIVLIKPVNPVCEYYDQKNKGMLSSHAVTNYSSYLTHFRKSIIHEKKRKIDPELEDSIEDPIEDLEQTKDEKQDKGLGARNLVVFDECHNIENQIVDLVGYNISSKRHNEITGNYIPMKYTTEEWLDVLKNFIISFKKLIEEKEDEIKKLQERIRSIGYELEEEDDDKITRMKVKRLEKELRSAERSIKSLKISVKNLTESRENAKDTHSKIKENIAGWVVTVTRDDYVKDKVLNIIFKPIDISEYCKRLFRYDKGSNFLLMSATILDVNIYCKSIGLDPHEVEYISLQSEFPVDNRPIYYISDAPYLNQAQIDKDYILDEWARTINTIMDAYHDFKGIIHVGAIRYMELISSRLSKRNANRLIKSREGMREITRDEVMASHTKDNEPTVIMSPSFHTGVDLKDNLSRFQIIAKVLFPGMADAWVKEKKKINEEWYRWLTSLNFTQAYGRSVRSGSDWADTYLTDKCFRSFFQGNSHMPPNPFIPKWVHDAIKPSIYMDNVKQIADKRRLKFF